MKHEINGGKIETAKLKDAFSWFAQTSKELLLIVDLRGRIKYMNASLEKVLHYDLSEVENLNFIDFIHEEDHMKSKELFYAFQKHNVSIPARIRFRRKDGSYTTLLWRLGKVINEGQVQVIGELVEKNSAPLRGNTENSMGISDFFDLTDEAAIIYDLKGYVLLVNAAFEQLYKWKKHEIIGLFCPTIPTHHYYEMDDLRTKVKKGEKIIYPQTVRMKKDGSMVSVSLTVSPVLDENGEFTAILAITKDLTKLVEKDMILKTQMELITSQEKLLLDITDNISDAISLYDLTQRKFLYLSPSFEQLSGMSNEVLYENPQAVEAFFSSEEFGKLENVFLASFNTAYPTPFEIEYKQKKNKGTEEQWIHTKFTPLADENGQFTRIICLSRDITERKRQDMALKKQDRLSALGQLAAGIAHEIRNPLTTIKGFIQLLSQESNDTDIYNKIILKELNQVESIVSEFLMLANPYEEIKSDHYNINEVLTEVIQFMRPEALLYKVEINTNFADSLPLLYCEPKKIKQAMMNVLKNAIEAMPSGGNIFVTTSLLLNGFIAIEVRDEGKGMPEEMITRLGEPFYSNKERGTGLGLMVSYKIIENHRGTIQIESERDKGTNVKILFPLK